MIASISKDFEFSASHQLAGLPEDHPCSRLHGHNYTVRLTLVGEVVGVGFVLDYRQLGWFKRTLDEGFDHRHLNDLLDVNPTAEHLAAVLCEHAANVLRERTDLELHQVSVGVSETPKTWATVALVLAGGGAS